MVPDWMGGGGHERKEVTMMQNWGLEQTEEEKAFRETWHVLKFLNLKTIFKPKNNVNTC